MTPGDLEKIPIPFERLMSDLEMRVMSEIVKAIKINGLSTSTADWQLQRMIQLGRSEKEIKKWIKETLQAADAEIEKIYSDALYEEYYGYGRAYKFSGKMQIPFEKNKELQMLISAVKKQTQESFKNLTNSLGFAVKDPATGKITHSPLMEFYQKTLSNSVMDIVSGTASYDKALKRAINTMTNSGVRWIDYESGVHNRVDVAARRAVMTGFRQVQGKINEQVAEELESDYYEVTYHIGARPTHQPWEGRVWSYKELQDVCGLGTVTGLHGANCYHDYNVFIPGVSVRTYTDEQLDQMLAEENTTKYYGGKEYTTYEALQEQRRQERNMRKTRQDIKLLKEGDASKDELTIAKAKYQGQMQTYKDFSRSMRLPEQKPRIYQDGLGNVLKKNGQNTKVRGIIESERMMSNGLRTSPLRILNDKEIESVLEDAKLLGIPESVLRFNTGTKTGFSDKEKIINIRGDIIPDTMSHNLRDRLSQKAVLAHEYYGHYKAHPSLFRVGDWRDEFRASYRAALDAPGLSDEERRMLILDAYDRAKEAGVTVKYNKNARRMIYGNND